MFEFNIIRFIPQSLIIKAVDTTVDVIVEMGRDVLQEETLRQVRRLRSDGAFRLAFEDGLRRASDRFVAEYIDQDEDLVAAIVDDEGFFENEEVQAALLTILQNPGIYLSQEQAVLAASFDSVLPRRRNRERVKQAVNFFLKCLAKEVWNLPELRLAYAAQFQRMTVDGIHQLVAVQKAQLEAQLKANQANIALSGDIRGALLALTDAIIEQKLLTSGQSATPQLPEAETPRVRHNLPRPDYERFVGRSRGGSRTAPIRTRRACCCQPRAILCSRLMAWAGWARVRWHWRWRQAICVMRSSCRKTRN